MPYRWSIDPRARLALVHGWGPMDLEESMAAPLALSDDPDFDPDFGIVVDLRELEYDTPQAADVMAVAKNLIHIRPLFRHRVAVVVDGRERRIALAAELGAAVAGAGGFPVQVFHDPDEAREWACAHSSDGD